MDVAVPVAVAVALPCVWICVAAPLTVTAEPVTMMSLVFVTVSLPEPALIPDAVAVAATSALNVKLFGDVELDGPAAPCAGDDIPAPAATAMARDVRRPVFVMNDPSSPV